MRTPLVASTAVRRCFAQGSARLAESFILYLKARSDSFARRPRTWLFSGRQHVRHAAKQRDSMGAGVPAVPGALAIRPPAQPVLTPDVKLAAPFRSAEQPLLEAVSSPPRPLPALLAAGVAALALGSAAVAAVRRPLSAPARETELADALAPAAFLVDIEVRRLPYLVRQSVLRSVAQHRIRAQTLRGAPNRSRIGVSEEEEAQVTSGNRAVVSSACPLPPGRAPHRACAGRAGAGAADERGGADRRDAEADGRGSGRGPPRGLPAVRTFWCTTPSSRRIPFLFALAFEHVTDLQCSSRTARRSMLCTRSATSWRTMSGSVSGWSSPS